MTRMQRIAGLDTSLTSTGIAIITQRTNGECIANTTTITSRGKRTDTLTERGDRLTALRQQILYPLVAVSLVVIELPYNGTKGGSPLDRNGLWWRVVQVLLDWNIPVATCPPKTRAKFATGSGLSSKAGVASAVARLWPDWEPASPKSADDEADALALAHAGAVWLGWDVPTLARHRDALPAIAWPQLPDRQEVAV